MKLGIIGGMGPLAGYDFGRRLTLSSPAKIDQDHIQTILMSNTHIPDRTSYILKESDESPVTLLKEEVTTLNAQNVDNIAIICNTSHFFYDELQSYSKANIYNMIDITMRTVENKKVGLISTQGTRDSKIYYNYANKYNIEFIELDEYHQNIASKIIYEQVKSNKSIIDTDFREVCSFLFGKDCSNIILGCTELSIAVEQFSLDDQYIDPIQCLINTIIDEYYGG